MEEEEEGRGAKKVAAPPETALIATHCKPKRQIPAICDFLMRYKPARANGRRGSKSSDTSRIHYCWIDLSICLSASPSVGNRKYLSSRT